MNNQPTPEQIAEMNAEFNGMSIDEQTAIAVGSSIIKAIEQKLPPEQVADILASGLDLYRNVVIGSTIKAVSTPADDPYSLLMKKGDQQCCAHLQRACAYAVTVNDEVRLKSVDRFYNIVEVLLDVKVSKDEAKGEAA